MDKKPVWCKCTNHMHWGKYSCGWSGRVTDPEPAHVFCQCSGPPTKEIRFLERFEQLDTSSQCGVFKSDLIMVLTKINALAMALDEYMKPITVIDVEKIKEME